MVSLTGAALKRRFQERFAEPAALKRVQRRAKAARVALDLPSDEIGVYETGQALIAGGFNFMGYEVTATPRSIWRITPPSAAWRRAAHGFRWLEDLAAVGGEPAQTFARAATETWIADSVAFDPLVWGLGPSSERLRSWLLHADLLLDPEAEAREEDGAARSETIRRAVSAHVDWVERALGGATPGLDRLRGAVAVATATLAVEGVDGRRQAALAALESAIELGVAPDGGWISRAPADGFEAALMIDALARSLDLVGLEPPAAALQALERLSRALRFFRSGDGGLPVFQGGGERADGRVDLALAPQRGDKTAPNSLKSTGYERLACGRALVFLDAGPARAGAGGFESAAGALSIELHAARRRVIVNCGPADALAPERRLAFRSEAAHSTVIVNDTPFATRRLARDGAGADIVGPPPVPAERKEEPNGMWLLASHDGYLERYGLAVSRRLFLSADGGDFRGEDSLLADAPDAEERFERALSRLPRARRERGLPFVARFHLHPEVAATLVADGEAATLRLPHGEVWVMRQSGGALALEDSRYAARSPTPETTRQLVIRGAARGPSTQLRWAFRRVGEVTQLPRDLEALGVAIEDDSFDAS